MTIARISFFLFLFMAVLEMLESNADRRSIARASFYLMIYTEDNKRHKKYGVFSTKKGICRKRRGKKSVAEERKSEKLHLLFFLLLLLFLVI